MRKIKEVLRLHLSCGLSLRKISLSCNIPRSTVSDYLVRWRASELTWPLASDFPDSRLSELLFREPVPEEDQRPRPDCRYLDVELRKAGVTLMLLWEEYRKQYPQGLGYTQFCSDYRQYRSHQKPSLRQVHKAGEKMFVDYAGMTLPIYSASGGEVRQAQLFIAVLGASNYSFAEATWSQSLPDWIGSHVRAFDFFKGVPQVVVLDNLKSGVTRPCRYDPDVNPTYHEMAKHYDCALMPTRVRAPKDKAKVESCVLLVERWILAVLRHYHFMSLSEANAAIAFLLEKLNNRSFQKKDGSRSSWYETLERPCLKPLPEQPYEMSFWKKATVHIDYHVEYERHYYSVPYTLIGKKVDLRSTAKVIEIFFDGKRIASHRRSHNKGSHTTHSDHRPRSHREYLQWTPQRILRWGASIGPSCVKVLNEVMSMRSYPEQGYRACLGILRLSKTYSEVRLEKACQMANELQSYRYRTIARLLKMNRDQELPSETRSISANAHLNIRGQTYYQ